MFSYLRYFFGLSIIVILAAAALFGWNYRRASLELIENQVELTNISFANSFTSSVWPTYENIMVNYYYKEPAKDRGKYLEYNNLALSTHKIMQNLGIVRLNLYKPDGELFMATTQDKLIDLPEDGSQADSGSITGYRGHISAKGAFSDASTNSELFHDAIFRVKKDTRIKGSLVRTLIPYHSNPESTGPADLVLEIYTDVTDSVNILTKLQYMGAGFVLVIFIVLYITLSFTSRRAEKIIERQHETNVDLASAKAAAETQNQQKSQFLASISHELRTPLNAIIGFSEIIKDEVMGALNNEQYKNYIKDIHSSGVHLLSLINDILDYSKAEAGKLDMEYEDIDITKLIASSLRLQEPRAKSAEVELVRELPNEHIVIRSDSKRLKQVMLNLLSNAVKFTPAGGSVKVSAWRNLQDHTRMFIEVRDTGIGIAPKDIAKALSPFGQVDSELSRRYEGTGLGLPLTKKFVELLGGDLKLESEVNKGTVVTISLPVNADPNGMTPRPQLLQTQES